MEHQCVIEHVKNLHKVSVTCNSVTSVYTLLMNKTCSSFFMYLLQHLFILVRSHPEQKSRLKKDNRLQFSTWVVTKNITRESISFKKKTALNSQKDGLHFRNPYTCPLKWQHTPSPFECLQQQLQTGWLTQPPGLPVPHLPQQYAVPLIVKSVDLQEKDEPIMMASSPQEWNCMLALELVKAYSY